MTLRQSVDNAMRASATTLAASVQHAAAQRGPAELTQSSSGRGVNSGCANMHGNPGNSYVIVAFIVCPLLVACYTLHVARRTHAR